MSKQGAESDLADLIAPIPGPDSAGISLRYEDTYQDIAEARREDDPSLPLGDWERPLKRADWHRVEQLCSEALATKSKDIQIAAWLTEAWLHLEGLDGFARGLALVESLCREYWDEIHPRIEDSEIEYRVAPFVWIDHNLSLALRLTVPIATGASDLESRLTLADWDGALRLENLIRKNAGVEKTAEQGGKVTRAAFMKSVVLTPAAFFGDLLGQVERCASGVARLERLMRDRLGDDTPGLARVREVLEAMAKAVHQFGSESGALQTKIEGKGEAGSRANIDEPPVEIRPEEMQMAEDRSMEGQNQPDTPPIRSREEAYRRLADAAAYLLRTEPHSPTPYLVMRAVTWKNMPLSELLEQFGQNEGGLQQFFNLLGIRAGK